MGGERTEPRGGTTTQRLRKLAHITAEGKSQPQEHNMYHDAYVKDPIPEPKSERAGGGRKRGAQGQWKGGGGQNKQNTRGTQNNPHLGGNQAPPKGPDLHDDACVSEHSVSISVAGAVRSCITKTAIDSGWLVFVPLPGRPQTWMTQGK
jgi:hypothetical protein